MFLLLFALTTSLETKLIFLLLEFGIELLTGRLPPVEEEIAAVDETTNRTQTDSRGQHPRQFHSTNATIPDPPPPQPQTLLNSMDSYISAMDQSTENSYLSSLQFNQLESAPTTSSRSVAYDYDPPSSQVNFSFSFEVLPCNLSKKIFLLHFFFEMIMNAMKI